MRIRSRPRICPLRTVATEAPDWPVEAFGQQRHARDAREASDQVRDFPNWSLLYGTRSLITE